MGPSETARHGPRSELRRSWRRFVGLLAADRPLVIGIDDAHWADDGLLDLLEEVVFGLGEAPLLLLCTSRPELLERRPDFGRAIGNVSQIELRPLDAEAARALAEQLLPAESRSLAAEVAVASGGNPFFAEEVSCALREGNPGGALPDTVQATIAGRIDLLPANEKRVLQHAAVLGHSFGEERLASLLGSTPSSELTELSRKALVVEHAEKGPGHFAFRHQLIRDVAYSSVPRGERVGLHERTAVEIEEHSGGRFAELAELRAFHLAEAAALEPSPERSEHACAALLDAAEIAVRRGAGGRALELYEQAAGLADGPGEKAAILKTGAEVALRRWAGRPAMQMLREAASSWEAAGEEREAAVVYARMVEVLTRFGGISGRVSEEEVASINARAWALADKDDEMIQTRLRLNDAWIAWGFDREGEMEDPAREGLEMARSTGDPTLISAALDAVQGPQWHAGEHAKAVETARERLELIDANPSSPSLDVERSDALHMMVESLMQVGSFSEAAEFAADARQLDLNRGIAYSAWEREMLPAFYLGEWDDVLETTARFREEWISAGKPPLAAMAAAVASAGAIHGYRGDERSAEEWFAFGEQVAPDISGQLPGITVWRADVDLHHGRLEEAAERMAGASESFWWRAVFHGAKAEAFARAGSEGVGETIETARTFVGHNLYAQGLLRRAEGAYSSDQGLLLSALELFEQIECPFQAARTGWLIGGEARERARAIFERLGAVEPAD